MGIMMQGIPETFNNKPRRHVWEYRSRQGEPIGYVARFDDDSKKEVIPYFKRINGHGWQSGSISENRPLYGLDILGQANDNRAIFIVEGEKAAAALQSLGLVAITSQGGSKAADKADWKPLEGRKRVYLLPDNDENLEKVISRT
jgi:DNA primase